MRKELVFSICLIVLMAIGLYAATSSVTTSLNISGLGSNGATLRVNFNATAPGAMTHNYAELSTMGTAETIDTGDVGTIEGILMSCVDDSNSSTTCPMTVDCNYSASYSGDIYLSEGEAAYFKPEGTVYVKNEGTGDANKPTYEYIVFGTQ